MKHGSGTGAGSGSGAPSGAAGALGSSSSLPLLRSPRVRGGGSSRLSSHSKKRRQALLLKQQQLQEASSSASSSSSSQASLLWTILLLGLCFCLADVAYILHYVETQQQEQLLESGIAGVTASSASDGIPGGTANPPPTENHDNHNHKNKRRHKKKNNAYNFMDSNSGLDMEEEMIMEEQLHQHDLQVNHQKQLDLELEKARRKQERGKPLSSDEWNQIQKDKQHLLQLFQNAKIDIQALDPSILRDLPTWKEVTDLYGTEPKIFGLDQCATFQTHSESWKHLVSTAGTFNSGTNLMAELLIANCIMRDRMEVMGATSRGIRWQVPWGKHTPPGDEEFRNTHKTAKDADVDSMNILPAVTIRDPYVWMNSMCRIEYTARWHHDPAGHCPNLVPNQQDLSAFGKWLKPNENIPVHVKYNGFWKHHDSLVHFWNDWYRDYWDDTTMSKLIVRYEDLLFWPQEVTEAVCHCAGGTLKHEDPAETNQTSFKFVLQSAKKGEHAHGPMETRTGYIKAIMKYGSASHRLERFEAKDLEYAKQHLDPDMMDFFHYLYA